MPRSIVTGAAGFVGSHLVERLLELGHEVAGIDCFTDYYDRSLKEANLACAHADRRFSLVERDLLAADMDALLADAEFVFHLAGQAGVRPSWGISFDPYVRHNILATQRLLEAAKEAPLTKFVFASSSSVYGNAKDLPATERTIPSPVSPYGVTKLAAEHLCTLYARAYKVPAVSLRLFTVYGPRQRPDMAIQRFLSAGAHGTPVTIYGDGTQTRDFTFVGDVVDAFVRAMDAPASGAIYNVCGGSRISINDLIAQIERTTGMPLDARYVDRAPGDAHHTLGDHAPATRDLGYRPRTSLDEGLAAHWRWLQEAVAPALA